MGSRLKQLRRAAARSQSLSTPRKPVAHDPGLADDPDADSAVVETPFGEFAFSAEAPILPAWADGPHTALTAEEGEALLASGEVTDSCMVQGARSDGATMSYMFAKTATGLFTFSFDIGEDDDDDDFEDDEDEDIL